MQASSWLAVECLIWLSSWLVPTYAGVTSLQLCLELIKWETQVSSEL